MSEPRCGTGKLRTVVCAKCDSYVSELESLGMYGGGPLWSTDRHQAPCGAFCWGAGVPPQAYRLKELHGYPDYPCPACSTTTEPGERGGG